MAPSRKRTGRESREDAFEGRDLLVGRPEGAERRSPTAPAESEPSPPVPPTPATSQRPAAPDDTRDETLREILTTVQALAVRIDAPQDAQDPERKTAAALARETAALTQAVTDARGALAKAAELAAGRDEGAEPARSLAGAAAALKTQGEALDQRIRATDRHSAVAGHSLQDLNQSATALNDQLRRLCNDLLRISDGLRWRHWRFGLAVAAASFVFFALGLVLQRATDMVSFGDPRDAWNDFVAEHYAPTLAACASEARTDNVIIGCRIRVLPSLDVTIPLYPDVRLTDVPAESSSSTAGQ